MSKLMKIILIILFFVFLGAGLLHYHTGQLYEKSFESIYDYDITLETNSELKNVTLYLPLPVYENESASGKELISRNLKEKKGWNLSIEETEHGKMLALRTDRFVPELHSLPVAISDSPNETKGADKVESSGPVDEVQGEKLPETERQVNSSESRQYTTSVQFHGSLASDSEIKTKFPIGSEPVLNPANNLTLSKYDMPYPENRELPTVYDYNSLIYADYETSPEAKVSLLVHFSGRNEWWIYGWNWNKYQEYIYSELSGPQQRWVQLHGKITMGEGNYR